MMDNLFMWSGTCSIPRCPNVKQSLLLCTLFWYQSGQAEISRSWNHVLQFLCKGKEGRCGRCHVFSRWWINRGDSER